MDAVYHAREDSLFVRGALLLAVLITPVLCRAQEFVRVVQQTPFSTTAPVFVPMTGVELRLSLAPDELALLLWKAQLANSNGGTASTELFLTSDGGSRWGLGSSNGRAANQTQAWANFDWEVGRDVSVFPMVRAVDGGTATVTKFEAVALRLGPSGAFKFAENFTLPLTLDDTQWTTVASATAPSSGSGQWLCFAQANVETSHPSGVSLRLRVGTNEFPVPPSADPRARFLSSGATPRMFFFAAPLTLMPSDVVAFEGTVNPRLAGGSVGATATLRDVRLLLIPQSVLEEIDEQSPAVGFDVASGTQVVSAQLPRTTLDGGWELLTFAVVLSGDGGTADHELITEPGSPPFVQSDVVSVAQGAEHPLLGTWVMRPVVPGAMEVLPQWWTRSFGGGLSGWGSRSARWRIDGGAPVMPVDSGVPDAGVSVDAGQGDAGEADASVAFDAGFTPENDGGISEARRLSVGCGCDAGPAMLVVLIMLLLRRDVRWRRVDGTA